MSNQTSIEPDRMSSADQLATATWPDLPTDERELEMLTCDTASREQMLTVLRGVMLLCLPSRVAFGGARRWHAGFVRMCALAWVVARPMIEHKTQKEFAADVGISDKTLSDAIGYIQIVLRGGLPVNSKRHSLRHNSIGSSQPKLSGGSKKFVTKIVRRS